MPEPLMNLPEPAPKPKLAWEKPTKAGQDTLKTSCGRYRCMKVSVMGVTIYDVQKRNKSGDWYLCLSADCRTFAQAQAIAQRDYEREI